MCLLLAGVLYHPADKPMKTKQLLILGGVFVVLILVVLLFENPFGQSEYKKKVQTAMPLFPNFDKAQVAKIEIIAGGETTTLAKQDGKWVVTSLDNYPADTEGVEELLTKVSEFKNTQRVSTNPDKQVEFEVESTTGVEAKLMDVKRRVVGTPVRRENDTRFSEQLRARRRCGRCVRRARVSQIGI